MGPSKPSKGIILRLATADLSHEWILTLCQMMAVAAVLAPLLLLFGLKYGVIKAGRDVLISDPIYREIRPMASKTFDKAWFDEMQGRKDVDFIVPMTRRIAATLEVAREGSEQRLKLDIVPTAEGDPLLLENGAPIPGPGECVLSAYAAEDLGVEPGAGLHIRVNRIMGGTIEYAERELTVAGILPERAGTLKSVYVPLPFLEAVEQYKDGQAVPEFGWKGATPKAYPLYDGAIVMLPSPLSQVEAMGLCSKTGFTKIEPIEAGELLDKAGYKVAETASIYRLFTLTKPVEASNIANVRRKLRGKNAVVLPWLAPINAQLKKSDGSLLQHIKVEGLSIDNTDADLLGLAPRPPWGEDAAFHADMLKIMLPMGTAPKEKGLHLGIQTEHGELTFPITVVSMPSLQEGVALVPLELGGILNLHRYRQIDFNASQMEFTLSRRGYAGFRLYAETIDSVDGLRKFFDTQGIAVSAETIAINKVKNLDQGMTLIFWLLSFVGVGGCAASLTASLYAAGERKKRDMGVLRLMGLSGAVLFRFPVYQGILIGAMGYVISILLFQLFSQPINTWFAPYLENMLGFRVDQGVRFCDLPVVHALFILSGTVGVATISAMAAAFRITKIEPAEALRDE